VGSRVVGDFLIIGTGIAGLRAALELASHGRVLVLTKSDPGAGSTGYAQGGIAAAVGSDDSVALHVEDTLRAGAGLCDVEAVEVLASEGPAYVRELIEWGAAFDRRPDGALDLAREGAHSVRRVLHARDATGREIARVLAARLADEPAVEVLDHSLVVDLVVDRGVVAGVRFVDEHGVLSEARATATLLATGGAGQVYRETTNPSVSSGDGIALAYLAGARVADLEFVQFHPTVLSVPGAPRHLLSEALRGEGATLVNAAGRAFMMDYEPQAELAPRDRVARAMVRESEKTGAPVFLSMAHLPAHDVHRRFPVISELCREVGLDLARDPLPVGPAAHYFMGGVATDLLGRTSMRGLFAAGEVAATGVHGANRLASNSLLEGLVFGARAGRAMRERQSAEWTGPELLNGPEGARTRAPSTPMLDVPALRDLMWSSAGIYRGRAELTRALGAIEASSQRLQQGVGEASVDPDRWRLRSLLTVGRLVVRAALRREESRGAHSRSDWPETDDLHWRRRVGEEVGAR